MKKFLALFLAIIIAITLVSCLDQKDTPTPAPDGGDASTTTTTTQKDNVPKTPSGAGVSSGEPPIAVYFSSPERISEFIEISNDSDEKYETYCREQDIFGVTLKNAQVVAHNLGIIKIPLISDYDDFNVKYNLTSNIFDAIYTVGEVRYRFIYYFNGDTEIPDLTERQIYKENMTLGDYSITLYSSAEQDSLSGFYKDNLVNVRVIIYTENFENISLDSIEFKPVDSIK